MKERRRKNKSLSIRITYLIRKKRENDLNEGKKNRECKRETKLKKKENDRV